MINNNPQTCNRWKYSKTKGDNSGDEEDHVIIINNNSQPCNRWKYLEKNYSGSD